jgi:hypothetical protein
LRYDKTIELETPKDISSEDFENINDLNDELSESAGALPG